MDAVRVSCPYCGEISELVVDADGGDRQSYVQDCPVCCRPWQVEIARERRGGWKATARREDE